MTCADEHHFQLDKRSGRAGIAVGSGSEQQLHKETRKVPLPKRCSLPHGKEQRSNTGPCIALGGKVKIELNTRNLGHEK